MRQIAFVVLILGVAMVFAGTVAADGTKPHDPNYPSDPAELVRVKWDAVINILRDQRLDEKAKAKKIAKAVSPVFDFGLMGKLALGRKHWPKLNGTQRKKYIQLFAERLKASYRQKISLYKDQTIAFKAAIKMPNKTVQVPTELLTGDRKYVILYKLRKNGRKWMVYDMEIQGVSILITYRSQFDDILRRSSVEEFLRRLEKPLESR